MAGRNDPEAEGSAEIVGEPNPAPFEPLPGPELVFGVTGAVGTDLTLVCSVLKEILQEVEYRDAEIIRLSDLLRSIEGNQHIPLSPADVRTEQLMNAGDSFRRLLARGDAVALLGIPEIRARRKTLTSDAKQPARRKAYILHSLKRPEEARTLRRIYGRAFHLIAAFANRDVRVSRFAARVSETRHEFDRDKYRKVAEKLVQRDEVDITKELGQDVRDTFPISNVFIDATRRSAVISEIGRFVDLIFGKLFESPTPDELGMYFAHAAALRSADLSRQVGAVIMRNPGEVIAIGCNEVPKPSGGHYWPGDPNDARDFVWGYDPSTRLRIEMVGEILHILHSKKWLAPEKSEGDIETLIRSAIFGGGEAILKDAQLMNVLEFGRVVHAEMSAITDAARRGLSVQGATLYCTTFPCHICARHIISSGVKRVVYIEPYPKSMAEQLYPEAICTDGQPANDNQIRFDPFLGIAPGSYADLFAVSGLRKDKDGTAVSWKRASAEPRLERMVGSYLQVETSAIAELYGALDRANITIL
ncbi:MAG TPA: anti-phage dCTP deaminase [Stellaceae bacterium]|nr:anti-phage dCTP deaminase [Stellaceae bacterium]